MTLSLHIHKPLAFLMVIFLLFSANYSFGQFTLDGSTLNSGDYTCGTSTINQTSGMSDNTSYTLTVCAAPGELVVITMGTIVLSDNGGDGNDDLLTITDSGTLNYTDGPASTGVNGQTVTGTVPGGCVTITLTCQDPTPQPQFNATINCAVAPNAGSDQSPGDCSTTTTLAGNDLSAGTGGVWSVSPAGPTITTPTSPTSGVTGISPSVQYTFTWTGNGGSDDMIFNSIGPLCPVYCVDPTPFTLPTVGHISDVNINGSANPSGWDGYNSNISCTSVTQGQSLNIDISIFDAATYTLYADVWIDWDGSGTFDADEKFDLDSVRTTSIVSINTFVPCDAVAGGTITMRVIMQYNTAITAGGCITSGSYGDVEDYCFTISPLIPPYAGPDQILATCVSSAALSADPIDATYTGTWTITAGGGTLSDPNDPNATITDLEPGVTTLLWTVVTPNCGTFTSSMTITTDGVPTPAIIIESDYETCLTTGSVSAEPVTVGAGLWTVVSGPGVVTTPLSNTSGVTGLVVGSPTTLQWTTTNAGTGCTSTDQITISMIAGVTASNAGSAQTFCHNDAISLSGNAPADGEGIWTGTGGIIDNPTDPNSTLSGISEGTYTYTWTISAPGCASSSSSVIYTINFCDLAITTVSCPGPITFTDGPGDYANDDLIVQKFCPDTPGQYITATFTQVDFASSLDHMIVLNGSDYSAPAIDDFYSLATIDNGPTIISSAEDGCLTFMFLASRTNVAAGWAAQISCQADSSTTNVESCGWTNCLGGCMRTLCGIPAQVPFTGDGIGNEELNDTDGGCLGNGEQCSNWFYINPTTAGTLTLDMFVNAGQDQDFAVWDAYGDRLQCPTMTGNQPLMCNFAGSSAAGTGFNDAYTFASYEPTLTITQDQIDASMYLIILVNTYNPGGACPQPVVDITFGGSSILSCDPPIALGVEMIDFTGDGSGRFNTLYWTTSSEQNNSHFILEGSEDGQAWSEIGTVEGEGTTSESVNYSLEDNLISARLTYYRLVQVDYDGKSTMSQTIVLVRESEKNSIVSPLFPNPSPGDFHFNYGGRDFKTPISINVYNNLGQIVMTQEYDKFNKYVSLNFNGNDLVDGIYQVEISQGENSEIQRISIIR